MKSPTSKYPLEPLLEHRERTVESSTAELGERVRAREAAHRAEAEAAREREAAKARAARVREEEAAKLERGELRAVDLAREQAWEVGAKAHIDALARAADLAAERAAAAVVAEGRARDELAQRSADRDVVVRDKARFEERGARAALAAEEEAAADVFSAQSASRERRKA